jgi:Sec-independent protein secretion pathway component TatC
MTKSSMILLSLSMIVLFLGPLIIIGAIKDRKEARRKQKTSKQ